MNPLRFLRKCFVDRDAAGRSARLTARGFYGRWYWLCHPGRALPYRVPNGGTLLLEPKHSFTDCFWPGGSDYYEPEVRALLINSLRPGHTFIDCGANVGYFSVQATGLVGKSGTIVAIEPNPETFELLKRNLLANKSGIPINCAITSLNGQVELYIPSDGDVYGSLRSDGLVKQSHTYRSVKVAARTLDEIVKALKLHRVDMIKIDVEGGELDVLNSATFVLDKFRPIVILEYGTNTWPSFGATPSGLRQLANRFGYAPRVFDMQKQEFVTIPDEIWSKTYVNLVLVPEKTGTSTSLNLFAQA